MIKAVLTACLLRATIPFPKSCDVLIPSVISFINAEKPKPTEKIIQLIFKQGGILAMDLYSKIILMKSKDYSISTLEL
jgi:hypothetical protein